MRRSARMISASLLMGLGMTVSGASVSAKPVQESQQPKTAAPQENAGKGSSPANPTPRPNPDASGIYHVGNGVTDPQVIYSVDPELTDKARKKKISGTCTIGLVVDIKGNPQDVHLVKSIAETVLPSFVRMPRASMRRRSRQLSNTNSSRACFKGRQYRSGPRWRSISGFIDSAA